MKNQQATDFANRFWAAESEQERETIISEFHSWFAGLTEPQQDDAREQLQPFLDEISRRLDNLEMKVELYQKGALIYEGKEYPLHEWLTLTNYAKLHGLKLNQVQNWINRGIVPADKLLIVPELNDLKLLRNEQYMQAS